MMTSVNEIHTGSINISMFMNEIHVNVRYILSAGLKIKMQKFLIIP